MATDKFLIAPIQEGLQRNVKPWLITDSAFSTFENAYNFRGRIRKRVGSSNVGPFIDTSVIGSRLRINIGPTDASGDLAGTAPGTKFEVGQLFSIGTELFTVNVLGTPGDMLTTGAATTHTYDTTTGAYDIQGADALTDVYFYPAQPVMGFTNYEKGDINYENTYAFDTQFAYQLLSSGWQRLAGGGAAALWTGTDSDFFWSANWRGTDDYQYTLFTTNYRSADGLRYFDGTNWNAWAPQYASNAADLILTARLIIPFQNRLLLFNTIEQLFVGPGTVTNTIVNRCRYSAIGSPIGANSFREDIGGQGGFIDAPTREAIVSLVKIKNRLTVFFERSTYELVYTGNQVYPFKWQQINSDLGCESTFSVVPFDKVVLGIGQTGIHACNGVNVERIDSKIPDEVFQIHNDEEGVYRVCGIKDYYNEMVYWSMPYADYDTTYPNRLLAYNYNNDTWSFFTDSVTAFGYHQISDDLTWADLNQTWEEFNGRWNDSELGAKYKYVIAGNQEGYTFTMHRDFVFNALSLQVTDMAVAASGMITITAINHNLRRGDWVCFYNMNGIAGLVNNTNYRVNIVDDDNFTIDNSPAVTGAYIGGGTIQLVSKVDIYSKQFNFYTNVGIGTAITKTNFLIDHVDGNELTIDYFSSTSAISLRNDGIATGALMGTSLLEMTSYDAQEAVQDRFWHAVYIQGQGENVQLRMYLSDEQMADPTITQTGFEIHGILIHASPIQIL